jgi:hypothetical protein
MDPSSDWLISNGQYALDFDGANDYVTTGSTSILSGLTAYSFSAWVSRNATLAAFSPLWSWSSNAVLGTSRIALLSGGSVFGTVNDLLVVVGNGNNSFGYTSTTPFATLGQMRHIAFVFRGSGATNAEKLTIYIDGIAQTLAFNSTLPTATATQTVPIWFGREQTSNGEFTITETQQWNRVLSANEVRLLSQRPSLAYELAPRRRASVQVASFNRRRRLLIGAGS